MANQKINNIFAIKVSPPSYHFHKERGAYESKIILQYGECSHAVARGLNGGVTPPYHPTISAPSSFGVGQFFLALGAPQRMAVSALFNCIPLYNCKPCTIVQYCTTVHHCTTVCHCTTIHHCTTVNHCRTVRHCTTVHHCTTLRHCTTVHRSKTVHQVFPAIRGCPTENGCKPPPLVTGTDSWW